MRGRNVSMEVKRGLRNIILLPTLAYGSETWTWNRTEQSTVPCCGNELSERSLQHGHRVRVMKVCMKDVTCDCAKEVNCGTVEWVESNTLRWFGHNEKKKSEVL